VDFLIFVELIDLYLFLGGRIQMCEKQVRSIICAFEG